MNIIVWFKRLAVGLTLFLALLAEFNAALAQNKEIPAAAPAQTAINGSLSVEEVENKIQNFNKEIKAAEAVQDEQTALQLGVTLRDLQERTARLRTTRWALEQLQTALKKKSVLQADEKTLQQRISSQEQQGLSQKPPFGLSFYDGVLDELASAYNRTCKPICSHKLPNRKNSWQRRISKSP